MEIKFERFTLENGLRIIFHEDLTTPMIAFNILYDVGAKDENPEKTGFAHLFEHLMFGGSVNIPNYDTPLQMAGGENNAYTTNDFTNYYIQLPKENIETAFWLESDRMLSLAFDQNSLDVQKKVVIEEFKEHYLSKPYGDVWDILRKMAYKKHPYQWMTIGKNIEHIEQASMQDVKDFFKKHYNPSNAIICVAGNTSLEEVKRLSQKWFADIPAGEKYERNLPQEPIQKEAAFKEVKADVPVSAIYKAWHIKEKTNQQYFIADILTEILGNGKASRLYQALVKDAGLFNHIDCYQTGSIEPGLLVIEGRLNKGISLEKANQAIEEEIEKIKNEGVTWMEIEKAKNKAEAQMVFGDISLLSRANNLAFFELLGDAQDINVELEKYKIIQKIEVNEAIREIFVNRNSNTLFYKSNQS